MDVSTDTLTNNRKSQTKIDVTTEGMDVNNNNDVTTTQQDQLLLEETLLTTESNTAEEANKDELILKFYEGTVILNKLNEFLENNPEYKMQDLYERLKNWWNNLSINVENL